MNLILDVWRDATGPVPSAETLRLGAEAEAIIADSERFNRESVAAGREPFPFRPAAEWRSDIDRLTRLDRRVRRAARIVLVALVALVPVLAVTVLRMAGL